LVGKIYDGGSIKLTAPMSPILVQNAAVLNVSGASGSYDVEETDTSVGGVTGYVRENEWSDAGSVSITGNEGGALFEGTLIGNPGPSEAEGGTLIITVDTKEPTANSLVLVQGLAPALSAAGISFDLDSYTPAIAIGVSASGTGVPGLPIVLD